MEEERRNGSMITGSEKISSKKKMVPGEATIATFTNQKRGGQDKPRDREDQGK